MEKTLTKTMPQHPAPTTPVRLHCDRTISEWETTDPEQAEEEQGSEVEPPPLAPKDLPEQVPMPELCSEDEADPLDEEKF